MLLYLNLVQQVRALVDHLYVFAIGWRTVIIIETILIHAVAIYGGAIVDISVIN